MGNVYSGNIQVERLLKSNLPIKDSGDKWYLVREDADSNICEMYITDSNGNVIPVADSTARKQINDLSEVRKTLFSGSVTNTATLSESITGGVYDKFLVTTGVGSTYVLYTVNFSGKIGTASTMTVLTATGYLALSFAADGQNITLTYSGTVQPLRTFVACKSGGVV